MEDDTWTPEKQRAERAALRSLVMEVIVIACVVLLVVGFALSVVK